MQANEFCAAILRRGFSSEDAIKCLLDLSETDMQIFKLLTAPKTTRDVMNALRKNQSTIQRSLSRLIREGLVVREKKIGKRGYYYEFRAVPKKQVRSMLRQRLNEKTKQILSIISKI